MIERGIDVWQGCMHSNNVTELVRKYGDKITFMGEIDNRFVDFEGWTPANCQKAALGAIERVDSLTGHSLYYLGRPWLRLSGNLYGSD